MTLEELQAEFLKQKEQLETLTKDNINYKNIIDEKTKREKELEEHNQKLFLRITSPIPKEEEKEVEEEKEIAAFIGKELWSQLSDKEIDVIKNIINGEDE